MCSRRSQVLISSRGVLQPAPPQWPLKTTPQMYIPPPQNYQHNLTTPWELRQLEQELHVEILPGTEVMADTGSHHFVKGSHRDVLVPQPSDDPHDPLNWSPWWKNCSARRPRSSTTAPKRLLSRSCVRRWFWDRDRSTRRTSLMNLSIPHLLSRLDR